MFVHYTPMMHLHSGWWADSRVCPVFWEAGACGECLPVFVTYKRQRMQKIISHDVKIISVIQTIDIKTSL